ncbi:MAG: dTDP-4-dehydrorhamnose 3,5-epimerase [Actinobacteria bacterium]|nr:dTDP-4-dehydrorhamnose 3,5-epimerase [Actinomycetota bacterium]MCG2799845.1 dTDP-4-dehydrorhamnose 3,5-epimerase [Cellulomonas sp.]
MTYRELAVPGAWEITPRQHGDPRGLFLEAFQGGPFEQSVGHRFTLAQANCSVSAAGALRGIHYADVPPGQAKYVTCTTGAVLDVVVDLRVGSPTFAHWDAVLLDDRGRRAMYLSEGLGHAFVSLADDSTVIYLCSTPYTPEREHGVHPLDEEVAIEWPTVDREGRPLRLTLSDKDTAAPSLAQARSHGLLPDFAAAQAYSRSLAAG